MISMRLYDPEQSHGKQINDICGLHTIFTCVSMSLLSNLSAIIQPVIILIYRYEAIKPGKSDFVVEYREKYWYCETEEKLLKFMK